MILPRSPKILYIQQTSLITIMIFHFLVPLSMNIVKIQWKLHLRRYDFVIKATLTNSLILISFLVIWPTLDIIFEQNIPVQFHLPTTI